MPHAPVLRHSAALGGVGHSIATISMPRHAAGKRAISMATNSAQFS